VFVAARPSLKRLNRLRQRLTGSLRADRVPPGRRHHGNVLRRNFYPAGCPM